LGAVVKDRVRDDRFESAFKKAIKAIDARYLPGALLYGEKCLPLTNREILAIERKLDKIWRQNRGADGEKKAINEFRSLPKRWYFLHLEIIEKYRKQDGRTKFDW
jgi:hypothetical protein